MFAAPVLPAAPRLMVVKEPKALVRLGVWIVPSVVTVPRVSVPVAVFVPYIAT